MAWIRTIALALLLPLQPGPVFAEVIEMFNLDTELSIPTQQAPSKTIVQDVKPASSSQQPVSTKRPMNAYILDAGDSINIRVFGQENLTMTARLDDSGVVNYPFLGEIEATGKTVSELEKQIASGLKQGYLRSPQVHVSIVEYRPFFIQGQVMIPGAYPYQPGLTLSRAVALGGGFTEFAAQDDVRTVYDKDANKASVKIRLEGRVYPGDVITVPESMFYIDGEVTTPGKYPCKSGLTLRQALALAGGLTERASSSKIYIKTSKGESAKADMDSMISSGSSIVVEQSFW